MSQKQLIKQNFTRLCANLAEEKNRNCSCSGGQKTDVERDPHDISRPKFSLSPKQVEEVFRLLRLPCHKSQKAQPCHKGQKTQPWSTLNEVTFQWRKRGLYSTPLIDEEFPILEEQAVQFLWGRTTQEDRSRHCGIQEQSARSPWEGEIKEVF